MDIFRTFLYLNDNLVTQYLAQVEAGIVEAEAERLGSDPAQATSAGAPRLTSVERTRLQTAESRFSALYTYLGGDLSKIPDMPLDEVKQLRNRTMIEAECELDIPTASRIFSNPEQLKAMTALIDIFGSAMSDEDRENFAHVQEFSERSRGDTVAISEIYDGELKMAMQLQEQWLRSRDLSNLEGDVAIVGKVVTQWGKDERHLIISLPGTSLMSRADRRKLIGKQPENDAAYVHGPGITIEPLAIYR